MSVKRITIGCLAFLLAFTFSLSAKNIQTFEFSAEMHGNHCKNLIEKTFSKTAGITQTVVNLKDASVKVSYDKDVISTDKILSIVNDDCGIKASAKGAVATTTTKATDKKCCVKEGGKKECKEGEKKECSGEKKSDSECCKGKKK